MEILLVCPACRSVDGDRIDVRTIERDGDAWRCEQTVRGINDALRVREIRQTRLI